jgi:precorrin-4 methylase
VHADLPVSAVDERALDRLLGLVVEAVLFTLRVDLRLHARERLGHALPGECDARFPDPPAGEAIRRSLGKNAVSAGTLADIASRASEAGVLPPAVIVVGEVVTLADPTA